MSTRSELRTGVPTRIHAIPGVLSWLVVIATIVGTFAFPEQWNVFAGLFLVYFIARMALHFVFYLVGEVRCRRWARRDWTLDERVAGFDGVRPADVHHVVLVPNYTEPIDVLRRTLSALSVQHRASERLVVALAMEEREQGAAEKAANLAAEFEGRFRELVVTLHPAGVPGELACKAANQRYAVQQVRTRLDELGIDPRLTTVTSCDADSVIHPKYFAAVSELFARDERRYARFWQAPLFYYNNLWEVPAPIRFTAWFTHVGMLGDLAMPYFEPLPISTYTASLDLLESCDWWDPAVISEDWHIYLDCLTQRGGDVCMTPVFLPVLSDAADGDTFFSAMKNRYDQVLRHSWGAEDVGFLVHGMRTYGVNRATLFRFGQVLNDHVLRVSTWFVLTSMWFAGNGVASYAVADDLSPMVDVWMRVGVPTLYTAGMVFLFGGIALDLVRHPPRPFARFPLVVGELLVMWIALPVTTAYLSMLPALHAQTKLMLGLPLAWKVTPKGRFGRAVGDATPSPQPVPITADATERVA